MLDKKMKSKIYFLIFLTIFFSLIFWEKKFIFSQDSCPANTQVSTSSAILVGEVIDDGGDPNLTVWFEYGLSTNFTLKTSPMNKYGKGTFCAQIKDLTPNQTYYYRAVAKNSAGQNYGEIKSLKTQCLDPFVDLKVNNSDGPLTLPYKSNITLSWNSNNASYCRGSWTSLELPLNGSVTFNQLTSGNYNYTVTCYNYCNQTKSDSVSVTIQSLPLPVIDFKANSQSNYLEVAINDNVTFSWTVNYANSCYASGDWAGTKPLSGSETIKMTIVKLYNFFLTCTNESGQNQAMVLVNVRPKPPTVITKPAVVTY